VRVGAAQGLTAWLLAALLSQSHYTKRLRALNHEQHKRQRTVHARRQLARWSIFLTSIPDLSFEQALTLARTRWQIERFFKLYKSDGAHLATHSPPTRSTAPASSTPAS